MTKSEKEKRKIADKAKTILASAPEGLKIGALRARLAEEFPQARKGTINSVAASLVERFPDEVCEPAYGWRCHTKYRPGNGGSDEIAQKDKLAKILLDAIPKDGTTISNKAALQKVQATAKSRLKITISKETYFAIRDELIAKGELGKGRGPGGSVCRTKTEEIDEPTEIGKKQLSEISKILFDSTPKDGKRILNGTALEKVQKAAARLKLKVSKELYFEIRDELITEGKLGKGRGPGGSVFRIEAATTPVKTTKKKWPSESALYPPLYEYIKQTWAPGDGIRRFVVDTTANLGRKKTHGIWTRPDLSLVAVHAYPYIPGKTVELVTFEIKPANNFGIEGVFETAAHSRAAHRSYLMIHTPEGKPDLEGKFKRLVDECERFHLGLTIFGNPDDWETFEEVLDAERRNPNPVDVNAFITDVMRKHAQEEVREMLL